jgi:hypothetical protein
VNHVATYNFTGVFLTAAQAAHIQKLMRDGVSVKLEIRSASSGTITTETNRKAAMDQLQAYAKEAGLPELPNGGMYGLAADHQLVSKVAA